MAMVVVDASCLKQADSQPKSCGLVWGSAATWRCSIFARWTEWTLAMTWSWWQHYKYRHGYYYYYYYYLGACGPHWTDFELVRVDVQLILFGGTRPQTRHTWKPTTDNGSYRQSLSNHTIFWWFVVPTWSRWRRCFMAEHAKRAIEEALMSVWPFR